MPRRHGFAADWDPELDLASGGLFGQRAQVRRPADERVAVRVIEFGQSMNQAAYICTDAEIADTPRIDGDMHLLPPGCKLPVIKRETRGKRVDAPPHVRNGVLA